LLQGSWPENIVLYHLTETVVQPASARARLNASPMPLAPPVTKAALPTNSRITLPSPWIDILNCGDLVVPRNP
jgi:hypothetical protein